jgi:chromate reductase
MADARDVAVVIGSLRKASITRKVANAMIKLAPETLRCNVIEIGDLALYNADLEEHVPEAWARFRERMHKAEAVLFATPEYNRSVPAPLKNAIDVGSRPYGSSVWEGKPCAIVSVSPGALGAFGANHHLRQSLVFLNMPPLQQPEAYVGRAADLVDDNGDMKNEGTKEFLTGFMEAFAAWIERTARV